MSNKEFEKAVSGNTRFKYLKKYYSERKFAKYVIDNSKIRVENGAKWNDQVDYKNFARNNDYKNFGFCLANMKSENIGMWSLYSKNGALIDFDVKSFKNVINNKCEIEYHYTINGKKRNMIIDKNDYIAKLISAIYFFDENGYYKLRCHGKFKSNATKNDISKMSVVKNEAWAHEREVRLVIMIKKNLLPRNAKYDYLIVPINLFKTEAYISPFNKKNTKLGVFEKSKLVKYL